MPKVKSVNEDVKPKSRAKYRCPDEVDEAIADYNVIPDIADVPRLLDVQGNLSVIKVISEANEKMSDYELLAEMLEPVKFPRVLLDHLYKKLIPRLEIYKNPEDWNFSEVKWRSVLYITFLTEYAAYYRLKISMSNLIENLESERESFIKYEDDINQFRKAAPSRKQIYPTKEDFREFPMLSEDWMPCEVDSTIERGEDGVLFLTGLAKLIGKFDDSRLRRCHTCRDRRIFWATRDDQQTCSKKCASTRRARLARSRTPKEKAELAQRRKENEIYKSKLGGKKNVDL